MKPTHLVIIGGVAAGPAAAAEARRTDPNLRISLFESGPDISYSACEMPHLISGHISSLQKLVRFTPHAFAAKQGVDVFTQHTVVGIDAEKRTLTVLNRKSNSTSAVGYDRLVIATGAQARIPENLNISSPDLYVLRTLQDVKRIEMALTQDVKHAVVMGSGYVGLDAAWALHLRGVRTTMLAPSGFLTGGLSPEMGSFIKSYLRSKGIQVREERGVGIEKAGDGKIIAVLTDQGEKIGCDFALIATGTKPVVELAQAAGLKLGPAGGIRVDKHLKTSVNGVWACGDCIERPEMVFEESVRMPLSLHAFRSGRIAGRNAARGGRGRAASMSPSVHTAAIGLGDLEIGHTGWTKEAAPAPGKKVISAQATHRTASSLSEHSPIHVELVAEQDSGRLIGGQIVGGPGSVGRINVITSLIRMKGTIDDLYDLDFVYAPTLAPAHDPLFVTARLLQKKRTV